MSAELKLDSRKFTTAAACAREAVALIEQEHCKLVIVATDEVLERIAAELEGRTILKSIRVVKLSADEADEIEASPGSGCPLESGE